MLSGWVVFLVSVGYLLILFAIAYLGDGAGRSLLTGRLRPVIYALALAVYCTSWTFLGSVGVASSSGLDFLPIYLGPILGILLGLPLIARIIRIAKSQRITSVADFISARYGKSGVIGGVVAVVAVISTIPYIALQLKAIFFMLELIAAQNDWFFVQPSFLIQNAALFITLLLAAFVIAFGTRHVDATEHQNGLILAVSMESLVKIFTFLFVGAFIVFGLFDGFSDLAAQARAIPAASKMLSTPPNPYLWVTTTLLSAGATFLLPRQFHMMVVENRDVRDLRAVAWLFPVYLLVINLFVLPIAMAGFVFFPEYNAVDRDFLLLALPLHTGSSIVALLAFLGALSAATAMIIVDCVACSIMISNSIIVPLLLQPSYHKTNINPQKGWLRVFLVFTHFLRFFLSFEKNRAVSSFSLPKPTETAPCDSAEFPNYEQPDMAQLVLTIRRLAVIIILFLGFFYYHISEKATLASLGLLSFSAIAQLIPAFFLGLFWQRAHVQGALTGLLIGILSWFYLLFLPTLAGKEGTLANIVNNGIFGLVYLAPGKIMGGDVPPFVQGVMLSLSLNLVVMVLVSLLREASPIERVQASLFTRPETSAAGQVFKLWRSSVNVEDLYNTVKRYLGEERTKEAFHTYEEQRGEALPMRQEADAHTLRFAEHLLASAIGAASARLVLSLMMRRRNVSTEAALKLLDDASAAIQYSRTLLQHGLDHTRQGVTVFDRELRLVCWNRAFQDIFALPPDLVRFGVGLDEIINHNAQRGFYGRAPSSDVIVQRITSLVQEKEPQRLRLLPSNRVMEVRSNHLPDGGLVTTYSDITEAVLAERALEEANATLEKRVRTRTDELTQANHELARAKMEAEEINASKTRFLAAASHDIIQPLNAARLYSSTLSEVLRGSEEAGLARNVEASLNAVEEILSALLEISRLDGGKLQADFSSFALQDLFLQLNIEFGPVAAAKGINIAFLPTSLHVRSDRRLLRRLLQNLVSNAVKYTIKGRVLIGIKRKGKFAEVIVGDTGIGIPSTKHRIIFREFQRLEQGARIERGLGLGLSIVERIVTVLGAELTLNSRTGSGTVFRLMIPQAENQSPSPPLPDEENNLLVPALLPLTGLHIGVIDNEPTILDGMRQLLTQWGCIVTTGASGREILAEYKKLKKYPDIVLVDYQLDKSNGLDTFKKLRQRYGGDLAGVLITADRSVEVRERANEIHVPVLNKPIRPSALRALLVHLRAQAEHPTE